VIEAQRPQARCGATACGKTPRRRRLLALVAPCAFAAFPLALDGCDSTREVRDALARLGGGKAIYGFAYAAPPPEGQRLLVSVHDSQTADPCALYSSGASGEFWYLKLEANDARAGAYRIKTEADSVGSATLKLSRVRNGEKARVFRAASGEVTSKVDLSGGGTAEVSVRAEFPPNHSSAGECNFAGTSEGILISSCSCTFEDGNQTTCMPVAGEDCCLSAARGEPEPFEGHWVADYCPTICAFTSPELAQYCYPNAWP
jgi:hypothetical protein